MTVRKLTKVQTIEKTFDRIAKHLINQRVPARDSYCVYRSADKKMCAIGCVIPDVLYTSALEMIAFGGIGVGIDESSKEVELKEYLHTVHPGLYRVDNDGFGVTLGVALQIFHDNKMEFLDERGMIEALQRIAYNYGINTSIKE